MTGRGGGGEESRGERQRDKFPSSAAGGETCPIRRHSIASGNARRSASSEANILLLLHQLRSSGASAASRPSQTDRQTAPPTASWISARNFCQLPSPTEISIGGQCAGPINLAELMIGLEQGRPAGQHLFASGAREISDFWSDSAPPLALVHCATLLA